MAFFFMSLYIAFILGTKYQQPEYQISFEKQDIYGKVGDSYIEFRDLPGSVQVEIVKLESLKRKVIKDSVSEIILSKINQKDSNVLGLIKSETVSEEEILKYIKDNNLILDDSLKERVYNKILVDKQLQQKKKIIDQYSSKQKIVLIENSLKKINLDEKNGIGLNNQGKNQMVFFVDLDNSKEIETLIGQATIANSSVLIYPIVRNNPYRDENLLKFVCMQNSNKKIELLDLTKSYLTVASKYECNKEVVQNNLYNVANYAKTVGIYSSGVLIEGQWVEFSENIKEIIEKRLVNPN